jgi:hypothetical protein
MGNHFSSKIKQKKLIKINHYHFRHEDVNDCYTVRFSFNVQSKNKRISKSFTISEKFDDLQKALSSVTLFGIDIEHIDIDTSSVVILERIIIMPFRQKINDVNYPTTYRNIKVSCIFKEKYYYDNAQCMFNCTENKVTLLVHDPAFNHDIGVSEHFISDYTDLAYKLYNRYIALALGIKSEVDLYNQVNNKFIDDAVKKIQNWWYDLKDR